MWCIGRPLTLQCPYLPYCTPLIVMKELFWISFRHVGVLRNRQGALWQAIMHCPPFLFNITFYSEHKSTKGGYPELFMKLVNLRSGFIWHYSVDYNFFIRLALYNARSHILHFARILLELGHLESVECTFFPMIICCLQALFDNNQLKMENSYWLLITTVRYNVVEVFSARGKVSEHYWLQ